MNKCYIITYDKVDGQYDELFIAIKSYGFWAKINKSTWAIVTASSASQIRDHLTTFLTNPNDRLFVLRSGTEAAWKNTECNPEWLKKNL